ncbi:GNAT family N-acetyltransferase [Saccharospirillum salsuginis]|uniref:Aminoglycoside N(6')-acetyltransferase type 1 n=1 Tax=Saccharospirillum salsuginis TaxID=418750 RepID=A0A918NJ61_9GAMM|nr:GNAT family N-acetyltransferase [Saccharospirillum salsuginis]GGX71177.1 aminoglycoside N(6')-acetyltransferase type 1 [Saccharospirillum salsuginis]
MADIDIREATVADLESWVALRLALWPDNQRETLVEECHELVADPHQVAFIAWADDRPIGLVEGALRGSTRQPYGHVEGWYVDSNWRGDKVAYELMDVLEDWFLHNWIETAYSDTNNDYPLSPRAHDKAGYEEVAMIRVFRKTLK